MSEQLPNYWSAAMSRRYWVVSSLFYVGALLSHLAFVGGDGCGFAFISGAQPVFIGMIVVLLAFELWAYRRYGANMTQRAAVGLIVAHMALFELTAAVDCVATATFLYVPAPPYRVPSVSD